MPGLDHHLEFQRLQVLRSLYLLTPQGFPALEDICRRAQEYFQVPMVLVTIVGEERQIIRARVGTECQETARPDAFCDRLIESDDCLVVPDATKDPRFAGNPYVNGAPFIRFYAGAPLIYMRDIRLGGLCVLDTSPREFTSTEQAELASMAEEVMFSILEQEMGRISSAMRS